MSNFQHTHKTGSSAEKKSSSSKTSTTFSSSRPQYPQGIHNNARDYIMHLQRTIGNQAVGRLWRSGALQRKLNIGPANDKYELEADAVADKVVSMNEPQVGSGVVGNSPPGETQRISRTPLVDSITPLQREAAPEEEEAQGKFLQRKCATCEKEEAQAKIQRRLVNPASLCPKCRSNSLLQMMQRKCLPVRVNPMNRQLTPPTNYHIQKKTTGSTPASSNIESSINAARGGGRSLSQGERSYYEPRFGTSFAGVKIHTDSKAAQLSRSVNARAFTVGREVFFGAGEYSPNTVQGKRLMAHELTHTVQQGVTVGRHSSRRLAVQRFSPVSHRGTTIDALTGSFTKEETGKIYKGNFERDFAQIPSVLVELVLVWKEWAQAGFPMSHVEKYLTTLAKVFNSMSTKEKLDATMAMFKSPFGGSKEVEHVDNPGGEEKAESVSGLPANIHRSREYIKTQMLEAFSAFVGGKKADEDVSDVRSRNVIENETVGLVDKYYKGTSKSKPMNTSEDKKWNVVGGFLGRGTHATEDFYAHSNWVEMAIYQQRRAQVKAYNERTTWPAPKYFPSDDDYQMSDKVKQYGKMNLFTGTFGIFDKIHAISDKVEALTEEINSAKLPPSLDHVKEQSLKKLNKVAMVLTVAAAGAKTLADKRSHSNIAKDSPSKDKDEDKLFENSYRCARAADKLLFAPLKQIMVKKDKAGLVKQISLVDQVIALPSNSHYAVLSQLDAGRLSWVNGKPRFH
ncbi:MAG: DUF4157 domain-containing protein [Leptospirales bacterium]